MSLTAADAAFEGFRLARRAPVAIAIWSGLWFVATLVSGGIMVSMAGPAAGELMALTVTGMEDQPPEALADLMARVAPALLALTGWTLVVNAVFLSAVARAVLDPSAATFGFLRLGATELTQLVNLLLWSVIVLLAYIGAVLASGVLAGVIGAVAGGVAGALLPLLLMAPAVAALLWLVARLSLSGAAVVDTGRVGVGRSWALSAGRVRPLMVATLLALVLSLIVTMLVMTMFAPLTALLGGGAADAPVAPDTSSLAAWFTPATLAGAAASGVAYALTGAILGGYGARAYQVLARPGSMNAKS